MIFQATMLVLELLGACGAQKQLKQAREGWKNTHFCLRISWYCSRFVCRVLFEIIVNNNTASRRSFLKLWKPNVMTSVILPEKL
jgi:hypothetical protein